MSTDYIDKGFRPDLLNNNLPPKHKTWLQQWGMDPVGVPVSFPQRLKAAVWSGVAGTTGEAPVLAVLVEPHMAARADHNVWYVGVLALDKTIREKPGIEHYLEVAEFGPSELLDALSLLAKFAPPDRYPGA